jgi:hypothetical protein
MLPSSSVVPPSFGVYESSIKFLGWWSIYETVLLLFARGGAALPSDFFYPSGHIEACLYL